MGKIIRNGVEYSGATEDATAVNYDNSLSGLEAQTVQEAIDELSAGSGNGSSESSGISIKEIGNTVIEVEKSGANYGEHSVATGTVTFKNTYNEIPSVFISPYGSNAMNIQFIAHSITTTDFKIYVINRGGSPINAKFNYMVL